METLELVYMSTGFPWSSSECYDLAALNRALFLDEAAVLLAGHRPCGECRHQDYNRFRDIWAEVHGDKPMAQELGRMLYGMPADSVACRS